ncbi:hypothetical protein FYK55_05860 [Roseiconus nitratireducens]|uniref:ATP synthase protein I n=1 Tax=Roseiconus nitratireducens TaxID=2605748 RepID=A0A5M6DIW3_9BACT|nr:hypothetical protein [Roseiconus nitratireducens]KAA5545195.1 hypothetical protein FYK55_05860 [Roseiconus nitratireducens]
MEEGPIPRTRIRPTNHKSDEALSPDRTPLRIPRPWSSRASTWCLLILAAAWALGMLAMGLALRSGLLPLEPRAAVWAGTGCGLVGLLAGLSMAAVELRVGRKSDAVEPAKLTVGFSIASVIRLVGTVALVALGSYQMPAAKHVVAGTILAWYVYLTTVEVTVWALQLPRLDQRTISRS